MENKKYTIQINNKDLILEIGKFAAQASGAVTAQYGGTMVLATATMSEARPGTDFMPLLVDYEEKLYAAGKIKSSRFVKREGRPSDESFLTARLVDRALRPLFPDHLRNDVQIILTVLSYDGENDPDIPALIAASTAVMISDIPYEGPLAAVRIGKVLDQLTVNPTAQELEQGSLDLVVAGNGEDVVMIEAGSKQLSEEEMLQAIEFALQPIQKITELQVQIAEEVGKAKFDLPAPEMDQKIFEAVEKAVGDKYEAIYQINDKVERNLAKKEMKSKIIEKFEAKTAEMTDEDKQEYLKQVHQSLSEIERNFVRAKLFAGKRIGGRKVDEIRPLSSEVGLLPRTHGSGLFQRGETQILTVATLGSPGAYQIIEDLESDERKKRFIHHYNFPPFSVGETAPSRWPSRRELGHGALAERALEPVLPSQESFPYMIRLVSEVMAANGSTSMASVCGSTLALMDAGVPIEAPVGGIAMGLITQHDDVGKISEYKILTDLQGEEDHEGDMDFKVTGTRQGITALQMDIKVAGITMDMMREALAQAKTARGQILDTIEATIAKPRTELSQYAPRIETVRIDPEKVRLVIGRGGETINKITEETGADIDISDDEPGLISVASVDAAGLQRALQWIKELTAEPEIGKTYHGKVSRLMEFGAFIEIMPGKEGLVHISQFGGDKHIEKIDDVVAVGDELDVILSEIDSQGRINLSLPGGPQPPRKERPSGPRRSGGARFDRGGRRDNGRRDRRPTGNGKQRRRIGFGGSPRRQMGPQDQRRSEGGRKPRTRTGLWY